MHHLKSAKERRGVLARTRPVDAFDEDREPSRGSRTNGQGARICRQHVSSLGRNH
jgi:hypothetical protein